MNGIWNSTARATIALVAATAALTACGSSEPPNPADKTVTPADLPTGMSVDTVPADNALLSAEQAIQQLQASGLSPAACKTKNVTALETVRDSVKSGVQQTIARNNQVVYGLTVISGSNLSPFEDAATGECAKVSFGTVVTQNAVRRALPKDTPGSGFILEFTRQTGEDRVSPSAAYVTRNGLTAIITASPDGYGKTDAAALDDVVRRIAGKL